MAGSSFHSQSGPPEQVRSRDVVPGRGVSAKDPPLLQEYWTTVPLATGALVVMVVVMVVVVVVVMVAAVKL